MSEELLHRLASGLRASPAELVGLAVLLSGVVACTLVLWWSPSAPVGGAVEVEAPVPVPAGDVTIHVSGAVAAPGVLTLPDGSRVADAVAAAGGATPDADLGALNLARPLQDGEQVLVPVLGPPGGGIDGGGDPATDGRVDLNRATAAELEELPGVGPVLAARIVRRREEDGPFTEIGQLREVSGIGEKVFQSLADLVVVR